MDTFTGQGWSATVAPEAAEPKFVKVSFTDAYLPQSPLTGWFLILADRWRPELLDLGPVSSLMFAALADTERFCQENPTKIRDAFQNKLYLEMHLGSKMIQVVSRQAGLMALNTSVIHLFGDVENAEGQKTRYVLFAPLLNTKSLVSLLRKTSKRFSSLVTWKKEATGGWQLAGYW